MALPNVRDLLIVPGKLSIGATSFTTPYPHGGTALGLTKGIAIELNSHYSADGVVTHEVKGNEIVEGIQQGDGGIVACVLHSWDNDALSTIFPNTVVGAASQRVVIRAPGTVLAGSKISARSVLLTFTPDDLDHHPMFVLRRALPAYEASRKLNKRLDNELEIGMMFVGIRDTAGLLYDYGWRHDLVDP